MKTIALAVMMITSLVLMSCASFMAPPESSWAFDKPSPTNVSTGHPQFIVISANVKDPYTQKTAINTWTSVPVYELIYKKIKEQYWAKYDIEIRVTDEHGVSEYKIFDDIETPPLSYEQTRSENTVFTYWISYAGKPGNYTVDIKVTDKVAEISDNLQISASIADMSKEFDISDPVFIKRLDLLNNVEHLSELFPLNPQVLNPWNNLIYVFEIYYSDKIKPGSRITVEYELKKGTKVISQQQIDTVSVSAEKDIIAGKIKLPEAISGLYELRLTTHVKNPQTKNIESSRTVVKQIRFESLIPRSISEMNKMTEPLKYYLPHPYQMLKRFKKAKEAEEKAQILRDFIEEQGHGKIAQFYERVRYAEKRYHGWESDQGKVFVKFGPPPADIDRVSDWRVVPPINYEVWHYPQYTAAHSFYFWLTDYTYNYKVFIFVKNDLGVNDFDFGRAGEIFQHNFFEFNDDGIKKY